MLHCGTQSISTERLILRRFSIDDAEAMYKKIWGVAYSKTGT